MRSFVNLIFKIDHILGFFVWWTTAAITREHCLQIFKGKPFLETTKTNYQESCNSYFLRMQCFTMKILTFCELSLLPWNTYFLRKQCFNMKTLTFWENSVLPFSVRTQHTIEVFKTVLESTEPLNCYQRLLVINTLLLVHSRN